MAKATEAADHLVRDHQHIVLVQNRLDCREVALGRHVDAARAHHRLGDEGADRVGALAVTSASSSPARRCAYSGSDISSGLSR